MNEQETTQDRSKNLTGHRFGALVAKEREKRGKYVCWLCECDCGNKKIVREHRLISGETKSCGCMQHKHGVRKHGMAYATHPRLYNTWWAMKQRCENENRAKYDTYGGRGIKVCDEWQDPNAFIEWALKNGYKDGLQIDRINNDGNYEPTNCRWVTNKENCRNRRSNVLLTIDGETKTVVEWCEEKNVSPFTVYYWVKEKGMGYAERRLAEIA